jgi:ubiquinone/menaquinone biosynthesis C-methylase UbiE
MKKIIKRLIPKPLRSITRRTYYFPFDTIDLFLGRRDELTPPKGKISLIGGGDYKKTGDEFLQYFVELGDLKPNEEVLDVGCGIGRMAVPLTKYLKERGRYEGFDIVHSGINWCKKKITPRYPNFHFQLASIYNKTYNPKGKYKAFEYKFPYANESFDFIFLTSVFTHMLPHDVENYFSEITRVLRREGKCLITFFLLNTESLKLIDTNLSTLDFKYDIGECYTIDKDEPESALAYHERSIRILYEKYGLSIVEPIHYGSWCGRKNFLSYQDIIIGSKKNVSIYK